jgi:hypothetical protein|tara:strand:+ start:912 stop:1244 length:333 start_codon:yes stop_codon:yes gene_type:complete
MADMYDETLFDMNIKKEALEDRVKEHTWNYHTTLLQLMECKIHGDGKGGKTMTEQYEKLNDCFKSVLACNQHVIEMSMNIAKKTLEEAFERCGFTDEILKGIREKNDEAV